VVHHCKAICGPDLMFKKKGASGLVIENFFWPLLRGQEEGGLRGTFAAIRLRKCLGESWGGGGEIA